MQLEHWRTEHDHLKYPFGDFGHFTSCMKNEDIDSKTSSPSFFPFAIRGSNISLAFRQSLHFITGTALMSQLFLWCHAGFLIHMPMNACPIRILLASQITFITIVTNFRKSIILIPWFFIYAFIHMTIQLRFVSEA